MLRWIYRGLGLVAGLALLFPVGALAQGCVESVDGQVWVRGGKFSGALERVVDFIAVIGTRDLYNSRGVRLNDFRAIIQQDRANLHKTGKVDTFDTISDGSERFFTTLKRRRLLSTATYYDYCGISTEAIADKRRAIENGTVQGALWVLVFRRPDGSLAVFTSIAG